MGDCELAEVLVGSCIASVGLLAVGAVAKACPVLHLMHSLCCTGQLLEARPGLISEASDNQRYTGLTWAEFGVEKGCVECQQVVEYLKVKKWELANEEASAAQVAGGSRSADLDGLTWAEGPVFKRLHVVQGGIAHLAGVREAQAEALRAHALASPVRAPTLSRAWHRLAMRLWYKEL